MTNKRSHKSTVTQPRLIKTKLEDALMSGQHDAVVYTGDPTEFDDTFALDCTDSLDLQKPCDPSSSLAPGDVVQAPRLIRGGAAGSEESVQLSRRQHLVGLLLDLDFQVPRYDVRYGRSNGSCAMQNKMGSRGFQSLPRTRRFFHC